MRPTRRGFLTGIGVGLGGLVVGPGRARAAGPRILLVGDSMIAGAVGRFVEDGLRDEAGYEVHRRGKISSGLARPDFYDWIEQGAALREEIEPDAVVVMFGGNDGQGLYMGEDARPKWIRLKEKAWTDEYRRRVNAFADAVAPGDERLFWVGMPMMRSAGLNARVKHMNVIYRAEMAIRADAWFVDIWRVLAAPGGKFTERLTVDGVNMRVRTPDGVHVSIRGAKVLARHIVPAVRRRMDE